MFEFVKVSIDEVTFPIERSIDRALDLLVALRGNVTNPAMDCDPFEDRTMLA